MPCIPMNVGGVAAIVCTGRGRQKRCACGQPARYLCDWKTGGGKTCDRPICVTHAEEVAQDKHLCVEHQAALCALARRAAGEGGTMIGEVDHVDGRADAREDVTGQPGEWRPILRWHLDNVHVASDVAKGKKDRHRMALAHMAHDNIRELWEVLRFEDQRRAAP